jgi:hypothetical protein
MAGRVVVILLVVLLEGCRGGQKEPIKSKSETPGITESTLIFEGESIAGWEITNFGPQGSVYMSGNEIILGDGRWVHRHYLEEGFPHNEL